MEVRQEVYPNLVLLVASAATDKDQVEQPNSNFRKSAAYVKASRLVDKEYVNLIVVITHALDLGRDHYSMKKDAMRQSVQTVVADTFYIRDVHVIFIENKFEERVGRMDGDFFLMPDRERNYANLKNAMIELFTATHDNIALLLTSHYFHPDCPEKSNPPYHHSTNLDCYDKAPSKEEKDEARSLLQDLNIYPGKTPALKKMNFSYLGKGYCPKYEDSKQMGTFTNSEYKVDKSLGYSLRIPVSTSLSAVRVLKTEVLNFSCKEDYERQRKSKLGMAASFKFIVSGNAGADWEYLAKSGSEKSIMRFSLSFCYEIGRASCRERV